MKRLLLGLGVAIAMTFAGSAWAQVPPDVPPGHWAYDAIEELVSEGIIKGYPDGTFKGRAPLTRYEFAIAIRDALAVIQQRIDEVRAQIRQPGTTTVEPPRREGEIFTREEKDKLGRIPADTAERLQRLEEAINRINRLATEFQDELASLGVDVEAAKRDLANLRRRVEAIEEEMKRIRITGDVTFVARGTHSIDDRTAIDLNGFPTGLSGWLNNASVLHELGLNITGRLSDTASAEVLLTVGNWLPYLGSASQFVARNANPNTDVVLWKAAVTTPLNLWGWEAGLTVGRFENRIHPLTLWRPDVDVYTSIDRYDNGYYSMDGGKLTIGFGPVELGLYAAKNNTVSANTTGNFMGVSGVGIWPRVGPLTPNPNGSVLRAVGHPSTQITNATYTYDQSAGVTLAVNLGGNITLSGEYIALGGPQINVPLVGGGNLTFNRADVFAGHLNAKLFERLNINVDYAQSDLLRGKTREVKKENWALLAGISYAFSDDLSLKVGYREVRPLFHSPGYWGRIGFWHNPTDIKGVDAAIAWRLGSLNLDVRGGFYKGTDRPNSYIGKDDEITHIAADLGWKATDTLKLTVSYEGVLWNLKTSTAPAQKPVENYISLGVDYKLSDNAALRLLYQVVDFDSKGLGVNWFGPGIVSTDNKARAGIGVAQVSVKF